MGNLPKCARGCCVMTTPYHAKYFAYELACQGGTGVERLSRSLFDACVDLNPHH